MPARRRRTGFLRWRRGSERPGLHPSAARRRRQVLGELRPVQPLQADPSGLGPAGQLGERGGDGPVRCHLLLAEGHHEQRRVTPELPHEVAKQQQRGCVGPVRIIQRDHQATLARGGSQERRGRVEEPEAGLAAVIAAPAGWRRGGPQVLVRSLELRHQSVQRCRVALQSLPIGRIGPKELIPDDLDPGPEGGCPLTFGSPAPAHRYAEGFRLPGQSSGQRRLADPRFPANQDGPTRPAKRFGQGGPQLPELRRPPDEDTTRPSDTLDAHPDDCSLPLRSVVPIARALPTTAASSRNLAAATVTTRTASR